MATSITSVFSIKHYYYYYYYKCIPCRPADRPTCLYQAASQRVHVLHSSQQRQVSTRSTSLQPSHAHTSVVPYTHTHTHTCRFLSGCEEVEHCTSQLVEPHNFPQPHNTTLIHELYLATTQPKWQNIKIAISPKLPGINRIKTKFEDQAETDKCTSWVV